MSEIARELEKLADSGLLKPADVVNAARDKSSPLHGHFCWDDGEAAERWREEQARQLIRNVRITVNAGTPVAVRAYVSLPTDREVGAGYRRMTDIISSEFMRRQLAEEINNKIIQWEKQAEIIGALVSFDGVKSAAQKVSQQLAA